MKIVRTVSAVRRQVRAWRRRGYTVGVVPTMGALHEGHLALHDRARKRCDRIVTTLFVNPIQFGPNEDFATYPRQEKEDIAKLKARHCDLLFAPSVREMFPDGHAIPEEFKTVVNVHTVSEGLCGRSRPGHFQGVATEVTKLLMITLPDVAFFGEKDYQQLRVIKRMVRDLHMPLRIEAVPTVREPDGLAMSSRNAYLTPAERQVAPTLYGVLSRTAARLPGSRHVASLLEDARRELLASGFARLDYLELVDAENLAPLPRVNRPGRLLAAAFLGRTRVIDNIAVNPHRRPGSTFPAGAC